MAQSILIVDDEKSIADLVEVYLTNEGYHVYKFYTAAEALSCIETQALSLVILDVMLPDMDGFALCQKIRETHLFPIIMLTAKSEDTDKIMGLSLGADDYITKPFGIMELISRVKALLRRSAYVEEKKFLTLGNVFMDDEKHAVYVSDQVCELTYKEYELLKLLMSNAGIVTARDTIMERIWGIDFEGESRTLDMHIKTLRKKLGEAGSMIKTVRNVGYIMSDKEN